MAMGFYLEPLFRAHLAPWLDGKEEWNMVLDL